MSFREDDFTRGETDCFTNCFHKHYRYLAYSNTLYSYLTSDGAVDQFVEQDDKQEIPNEELY